MSKTFKEFRESQITGNEDLVDVDEMVELQDGMLRTVGGVGLTMKIQSVNKEIKNVHYNRSDDIERTVEKLFKKVDLLSKQITVMGVLVTQLGLMSGNNNNNRRRR